VSTSAIEQRRFKAFSSSKGESWAAARAFWPDLEVYGVEPEGDDWARSIESGRIGRISSANTIADGLRSLEPGRIPFPLVKEVVRGILRVSEDDIRRAMLLLLTRAKIVTEPTGAVSVAGGMAHVPPSRTAASSPRTRAATSSRLSFGPSRRRRPPPKTLLSTRGGDQAKRGFTTTTV